jgi:hypothetical protein
MGGGASNLSISTKDTRMGYTESEDSGVILDQAPFHQGALQSDELNHLFNIPKISIPRPRTAEVVAGSRLIYIPDSKHRPKMPSVSLMDREFSAYKSQNYHLSFDNFDGILSPEDANEKARMQTVSIHRVTCLLD